MASTTEQATKSVITLKGSTDIVLEFFNYSINSILYQRGIYPPENFSRVSKYGLAILVTKDEELKEYLRDLLDTMQTWVETGDLNKLVVVITGLDSGETLERWVFNIEKSQEAQTNENFESNKSEKEVKSEIQAIIRQITASVTFLPLLNEACSFEILVYTNKDTVIPQKWEDSNPKMIDNAQEVKLRSFSTKIHKVDAAVTYRDSPEDDVC